MGLAIAGAALAIGGAVYGGVKANQAAGASKRNAGAFQDRIDEALKAVPNVKPVTFDRLKLPTLNSAYSQYLHQPVEAISEFNKSLADRDNGAWRNILSQVSPGLLKGVALNQRNINKGEKNLRKTLPLIQSRLHGELSAEDQANISRSDAYQSLRGGFGANSGSGRALEARDLGRTSEELQTQGFDMLRGWIESQATLGRSQADQGQVAAALSPRSGATTLFDPTAILARKDSSSIFNTQVSNAEKAYNTSIDFENQNAKFQALLQSAGLNYQTAQAGINAQAQADQTVANGISSVGGAVAGLGSVDWTAIGSKFGFGGTGRVGTVQNGAVNVGTGATYGLPDSNAPVYRPFSSGPH